ncbi:MAG: ATP-binding cassette domain-containing protein [bacterium]
MVSVSLRGITFAFGHQHALFSDVTCEFRPGWTALVGPNGSGKSTLLALILGDLEPQVGHVSPVGGCLSRQNPDFGDVADFAAAWDPESMRWKSWFGLDGLEPEAWSTLSPGVRRRWAHAAAFAKRPLVLMLDEPTNHLDAQAKVQLARAMADFDGVGILISHDRDFIQQVCSRIIRLNRGQAATYEMALDQAQALWSEQTARVKETLDRAQDEMRALSHRLAHDADEHRSAKRQLSVKARRKNVGDKDAASIARKSRAQKAESKLGRAAKLSRAELERAAARVAELPRPEPAAGKLKLDAKPAATRWVFDFEGDVWAGDRQLFRAKWALEAGARVWLTGPNGAGKTSLIAAVTQQRSDCLVLSQVIVREQVVAAWDDLTAERRNRTLHIAATMRLDVTSVLDGSSLSPGELRKLALAIGLVMEPILVVLDEPTNDLDMDTIDAVAALVREFPGAVVVISHDGAFARRLGLEEVRLRSVMMG